MGNCLDIPPPAPKRRPLYVTKPHYLVGSRTPSAASVASLQSAPSMYSPYQPYPAFGGSSPLLAIDPVTGRTFVYTLGSGPLGAHPYYSDEVHQNGGFSYYDEDLERTSHTRRRHRRRERRTENGGIPDRNGNTRVKNANVNSTLITTFPDPADDIIQRGHEIVVSKGTPRTQNGVISTVTAGSIKTTTSTTAKAVSTTAESSTAATEVTVNQNLVVQSQVMSAPVAKRGSTYITYIEDEPPPPEPEEVIVEETTEIVEETTEETTHVQSEEHVAEGQTGGFIEKGEADEQVIQLYIDDPVATTTTSTSEVEMRATSTHMSSTVVSSTHMSSNSLKKIGMRHHHSSMEARDVVICYDPVNTIVMLKIKRELETAGLTVTVSNSNLDGVNDDFTDWLMFPQAIIDAKLMVVLLSPESVKSKQLREEVSLAHLTDTSIFPVAVGTSMDILGAMDVGLKLQLAAYQWTELAGEISADISIDFMVRNMHEELEVIRGYEIIDEDYGQVSSWAQRRQKFVRQRQLKRFISFGSHVSAVQYWDRIYASGEMTIPWDRFYKDFRSEYREALGSIVPKHCTPQLIDSLKRELAVDSDGLVHKAQFIEFCSDLGTDQDVWERVRGVAREAQAIRDVFDVESSVRLVAIENIGKFGSHNVMSALRELLADRDPNIRAVATVSLSRCMLPGDETTLAALLATLDDKDRLVREAGCLAMGHLRAEQAMEKLLHVWRNDVISHVREAAGVALNEIGGKEVENAMRVTDVLTDEIRTLSDHRS